MTTNRATRPSDLTALYGALYIVGVLAEHALRFLDLGGRLHVTASGRVVAIAEDGVAYPVVCSDLVEIRTEDGPEIGRCGGPVFGGIEGFACEGHTAERLNWLNASEIERAAWERRHDQEVYG